MKIKIFGYEIAFQKESDKLEHIGARAKADKSLSSIHKALDEINNKGLKYSEYRVQKLSGVSLNTVKKYRDEISEYRAKISRDLFA